MSYDPDPGALLSGIDFTRQLSERDLSLRIPVNFVTARGVGLTPACFAHKRYIDGPAAKCFSNLLAIGFHRLELDIYWDANRQVWSLCPVEVNPSGSLTTTNFPSSSSSSSSSSTGSNSTASSGSSARVAIRAFPTDDLLNLHPLLPRQKGSLETALVESPTATLDDKIISAVSSLGPSGTRFSSTSPKADRPHNVGELYAIGPYSCTSTINLPLFTKVLKEHMEATQTKVNATLKYLVVNMHAAAPASDPTGSGNAPSSSNLPDRRSTLSSVLGSELSSYLYTPKDLKVERANLNTSWYDIYQSGVRAGEPDSAYFEVEGHGDHTSTPDGWPSESVVEMEYAKRLFASYGRIDPQLLGYNFSADRSTIFGQNYLVKHRAVSTNQVGEVEHGCYYRPNVFSISSVNNSWAMNAIGPATSGNSLPFTLTEGSNLTACGISPLLNETLDKKTADVDFRPYERFVQQTTWSWAPNQPHNGSRPGQNPATANRCAALNSISGHWQTEDCRESHHSACRKFGDTYNWAISDDSIPYAKAGLSCQFGAEFTVPHTALENKYLVHTWRQAIATKDYDDDDELLWVNFNDLDARACWVIGENTTCPYLNHSTDDERTVLIPTIAGIIIFVLAGLTIFTKYTSNRRKSKRRRRRGEDGWDYEGVPS